MPKLSAARQATIAARTVKNILFGKPITVSFEVTYNCNANCEHCDLGDFVKEPHLGPSVFGDWIEKLRPTVSQISGGEPLLRKDVLDIISEMRRRDPVSVFVITTNVSLMNEEKYHQLREAGIDQFSFSLDYPDERHNVFRHLERSFEHVRDMCKTCSQFGNKDIVLACVVQSDNFRDLPRIAELAREWGVAVNFSTYNAVRTGKEHYLITGDDLRDLSHVVDKLVIMQKDGYPIVTSEWTMRQMIDFFDGRKQPNCRAGNRFLIVGPWGKLTPCGMFRDRYETFKEMNAEFVARNRCTDCFTSSRANSEKSPMRMLSDAVRAVMAG